MSAADELVEKVARIIGYNAENPAVSYSEIAREAIRVVVGACVMIAAQNRNKFRAEHLEHDDEGYKYRMLGAAEVCRELSALLPPENNRKENGGNDAR